MTIENISIQEFEKNHRVGGSKHGSFRSVVTTMEVGDSIKYTCVWKHIIKINGERGAGCLGANYLHQLRKKLRSDTGNDSINFKSHCYDGNFYVLRTS
jgi:hypothetical protein